MKKTLIFLSFISIITACNSKTSETSKDSTIQTDTVASATKESEMEGPMCFLATEGPDSTMVMLYFDGENATGKMRWMPHEKDGAIGTLQGKMNGDTFTGDYSYTIEGSEQVEEKIFVLKGDVLEEKSGELEDKNGKLIIKDRSKLTTQATLKKVDCEVIEKYLSEY